MSLSWIRRFTSLLGRKPREVPATLPPYRWSIGIYTGGGPFSFSAPDPSLNPVLTAESVTDVPANFVADPFMVREGGSWYMFFEVEAAGGPSPSGSRAIGKIGLASSPDGFRWRYERIVLEAPFHLSYPYVFRWEGAYYMVPETRAVREVRLYRAVDFPYGWQFAGVLLKGRRFADSSLFHFEGRWWMFTDSGNTTLRLYWAEGISGPWREHPKSPLIRRDPRIARPGGRAVVLGKEVIRYAQDDLLSYGSRVWGFRVAELTPKTYREEAWPSPVIAAEGRGWNRFGMHTIDPHPLAGGGWIACVDGFGEE
ncbi:hypothetical protein [Desulfococcus sp.]|uniref:glucosamine inositolphosphorylceramide transferase family protein n=1 Tax=Desulfococcus sp. TaxID=2025834 RepID=UPI0035944288